MAGNGELIAIDAADGRNERVRRHGANRSSVANSDHEIASTSRRVGGGGAARVGKEIDKTARFDDF